jgi:hypothetical protein
MLGLRVESVGGLRRALKKARERVEKRGKGMCVEILM